MARKTTFEETRTFETTGVDDDGGGGDRDEVPGVFLSAVGLNQTPEPGGRVTLEVAVGADEATDAWVTATIDGEEVLDFDWLEAKPSSDAEISAIIESVPYADEFEVQLEGGPVV